VTVPHDAPAIDPDLANRPTAIGVDDLARDAVERAIGGIRQVERDQVYA
jgi:hypothetical protein